MASLRPPTLDQVGLEAALRDQVGAFTRHSGVECSVRVELAGGRFQLESRPGAGSVVRATFTIPSAA